MDPDLDRADRAASPGEALLSLLSLWRRTRDATVADTIDALSQVAGSSAPAADLAASLPLIPSLADPRLTRDLLAAIQRPSFGASSTAHRRLWREIFEAVAALADPRSVAPLASLQGRCHELGGVTLGRALERLVAKTLPSLRAAVAALHAPLDEASAARLRELRVRHAGPPAQTRAATPDTAAQLLAAVADAPDDDGPRLVYADWLSERDDPRGEFIALQCRAHPTDAERERAELLLRAHRSAWLGPLALAFVRSSVVFERGFPVSATVREHWDLAPLVGHEGLATLRHLDVSGARGALALVRDPACRNLTSLRCIDGVSLFERGPAGLVDLEVQRAPGASARAIVAEARGLPSLRGLKAPLADDPEAPGWLLSGALGARLERLDLGAHDGPHLDALLAAWVDRLLEGPLTRLAVASAASTWTLSRVGDGVALRVDLGATRRREVAAVAATLRGLPPGSLAEVRVSPDAVARLVEGEAAELTPPPSGRT
jgi:uncharacterized protein (TIGR02996 family)